MVQKVKIPRFLIFDIIFFESQNFGKMPFDQRLRAIDVEIIGPRTQLRSTEPQRFSRELFSIRNKPFYPLGETRKVYIYI